MARIPDFATIAPDKYSQLGEGAILRAIFAAIGTTNRVAVEFGADNGLYISNTALLRLEDGWRVILMDADPKADIVHKEWITAENVNAIFRKYDVPAQLDLVSIDVDGNDFWVWDGLRDCVPRVVVIEYNANFDADKSVAIRYDPHHTWDKTDYYGASLRALWKLAAARGYALVGITRTLNAFFVLANLVDPDDAKTPEQLWPKGSPCHLPDNRHRSYCHI